METKIVEMTEKKILQKNCKKCCKTNYMSRQSGSDVADMDSFEADAARAF
jgi:hypothetical protein